MQTIQRIEDVTSRALFTMTGSAVQIVEANAGSGQVAPAAGSFPTTLRSNQVITLRATGANPIYVHYHDSCSNVYYVHKLSSSDPDAKYLSVSNKVKLYFNGMAGEQLEVCVLQ